MRHSYLMGFKLDTERIYLETLRKKPMCQDDDTINKCKTLLDARRKDQGWCTRIVLEAAAQIQALTDENKSVTYMRTLRKIYRSYGLDAAGITIPGKQFKEFVAATYAYGESFEIAWKVLLYGLRCAEKNEPLCMEIAKMILDNHLTMLTRCTWEAEKPNNGGMPLSKEKGNEKWCLAMELLESEIERKTYGITIYAELLLPKLQSPEFVRNEKIVRKSERDGYAVCINLGDSLMASTLDYLEAEEKAKEREFNAVTIEKFGKAIPEADEQFINELVGYAKYCLKKYCRLGTMHGEYGASRHYKKQAYGMLEEAMGDEGLVAKGAVIKTLRSGVEKDKRAQYDLLKCTQDIMTSPEAEGAKPLFFGGIENSALMWVEKADRLSKGLQLKNPELKEINAKWNRAKEAIDDDRVTIVEAANYVLQAENILLSAQGIDGYDILTRFTTSDGDIINAVILAYTQARYADGEQDRLSSTGKWMTVHLFAKEIIKLALINAHDKMTTKMLHMQKIDSGASASKSAKSTAKKVAELAEANHKLNKKIEQADQEKERVISKKSAENRELRKKLHELEKKLKALEKEKEENERRDREESEARVKAALISKEEAEKEEAQGEDSLAEEDALKKMTELIKTKRVAIWGAYDSIARRIMDECPGVKILDSNRKVTAAQLSTYDGLIILQGNTSHSSYWKIKATADAANVPYRQITRAVENTQRIYAEALKL